MIFWWIITLLHCLSIYFQLLRILVWIHSWMIIVSVSRLRIGARVRFPLCSSSRRRLECQACKYHKFILDLRLAHFREFRFFYDTWVQLTQNWVHYFKSFSRVKLTQDEKVRFIKKMNWNIIKLSCFHSFLRMYAYNKPDGLFITLYRTIFCV